MKRRTFVQAAGAGAVAAALLPRAALAAATPFSAWTWVHGGGTADLVEWRQRYARLRDAGLTGVLVGGGETAMHNHWIRFNNRLRLRLSHLCSGIASSVTL